MHKTENAWAIMMSVHTHTLLQQCTRQFLWLGLSFHQLKCERLLYCDSLNVNRFIYLGFYVAFNTIQVISRWVVGRAEETSTFSSLGFCTVNCRPMASNYQLSHLRPCRELNPGLRGGRQECYHSATMAPKCK